jgi:hypothetical protein
MAGQWYYKIDDKILGPVSESQLNDAVKAGAISRSTRVRLGENGPWGPASLIRGLFAAIESEPTLVPIEELSELHNDLLSEPIIESKQLAPRAPLPRRNKEPRGSASSRRLYIGVLAALVTIAAVTAIAAWIWSARATSDGERQDITADMSSTAQVAAATASTDTTPQIAPTPAPPSSRVEHSPSASTNGAVLYLSDLKEKRHEVWEYHPGFGFGTNGRFLDGKVEKSIVLGGMPSPKGILAHPTTNGAAKVIYDVKGREYKFFEATIGVNDDRHYGPHTALIFEVLGDGKLLWQSKPVAGWGQPQPCSIALPAIAELELRVRCPGDASFAFAVWCEPRLTNEQSLAHPKDSLLPTRTATNLTPGNNVAATEPRVGTSKVKPAQSINTTLETLVLPSGATVDVSGFRLTPAAAKAAFTSHSNTPAARKSKSKSVPLAHFAVSNGLLTFNNKGELHGPTLVFLGDRKLSLSYANNQREGALQCWNDKGELEIISSYKSGRKLGITSVLLGGQPQLVEDWPANQVPSRYFVSHVDDPPSLTKLGGLKPPNSQLLKDAEDLLGSIESQVLLDEREWRKSLRAWWSKNDTEFKRMNQSLAAAKDKSSQNDWQQKLRSKRDQLSKESDRARRDFFARF